MVQDSLVEYISSQIKLGVSKEAIRQALVGAGWQAADVEDTLKKVDSLSRPTGPNISTPATVAAAMTAQQRPVAMGTGSTGSTMGGTPQSIRVSDLVSASGSASTFSASPALNSASPNKKVVIKKQDEFIDPALMKAHKSSGGFIMRIVMIVAIVALAGLAAYLYFQNSDLSTQVAKVGSQTTTVTSQVTSLNAQVAALNASNTALAADDDAANAMNKTLLMNLSFVVIPPGTTASSTPDTVSVDGMLKGGGKNLYSLTTQYGVVILVQNSKDVKVDAALKPLANGTSSVTLGGTHVLGSQYLNVTSLNGTTL